MAVAAAAGPMDPKTVVAAGYAEILVKPDIASLKIGVGTIERTSAKALDANLAAMRRVLAAIKAAGVNDVDIQTSDFSVTPIHPTRQGESYGYDVSVTVGYGVSDTLIVTVRDLSKVGEVIDNAIKAGANLSNSVTFDVSNRKNLESKALADAVKDARHNAQIMADDENAKVGKLVAVSNTSPVEPQWVTHPIPNAARGEYMESVVVVEGVIPVGMQVMAVYALE